MKIKIIGVFILVFWPISLVGVASASAVAVTSEICGQLFEDPNLNVDVTYRPGTDVEGGAVVPADLPEAGAFIPPSDFKIPLKVDLSRYDQGKGDLILELDIGEIESHAGGASVLNGAKLKPSEVAALQKACKILETQR